MQLKSKLLAYLESIYHADLGKYAISVECGESWGLRVRIDHVQVEQTSAHELHAELVLGMMEFVGEWCTFYCSTLFFFASQSFVR